ncbi:hypothetical protein ACJX0J_022383, partial [Zea mays]
LTKKYSPIVFTILIILARKYPSFWKEKYITFLWKLSNKHNINLDANSLRILILKGATILALSNHLMFVCLVVGAMWDELEGWILGDWLLGQPMGIVVGDNGRQIEDIKIICSFLNIIQSLVHCLASYSIKVITAHLCSLGDFIFWSTILMLSLDKAIKRGKTGKLLGDRLGNPIEQNIVALLIVMFIDPILVIKVAFIIIHLKDAKEFHLIIKKVLIRLFKGVWK